MRQRCVAVVLAAVPLLSLPPFTPSLLAQQPIRVVRHAPVDTARSGDAITISFDRPVVGSLDRTPDPATIVRIEPPIDARIQWRDPVTLRVLPRDPLTPARRYRVTVSDAFVAIDGGRLEAPYTFTLVTRGPAILASVPELHVGYPSRLDPNGNLRLVYSAPVDSAVFARTARLEINASNGDCKRQTIALAVRRQRKILDTDDWSLRYAGGYDRDTTEDRFRRVVDFRLERRAPEDCAAALVLPSLDPWDRPEIRYPIATQPKFAIGEFSCLRADCAAGETLQLDFTAAVYRDSLLPRIHLSPEIPYTVSETGDVSGRWSLRLTIRPRTTYRVAIDSTLTDVFGRRLTGGRERSLTTGDRVAALGHQLGFFTLSRAHPALRITHVNVDSAQLVIVPIPDSLRATILDSETDPDSVARMVSRLRDTVIQPVSLRGRFNEERITEVGLSPNELGHSGGSLFAIRARSTRSSRPTEGFEGRTEITIVDRLGPDRSLPPRVAIVQFTDLLANAKVADGWGSVLVTNANDGRPAAGAFVTTRDARDSVIASGTTDGTGVADLRGSPGWRKPPTAPARDPYRWYAQVGDVRFVEVKRGDDRSLTPIAPSMDGGTSDVIDQLGGSHETVHPLTAMVVSDRGIYRPGETVYLTSVLRLGHIGDQRVPAAGDSIRLRVMHDIPGERDPATIRDTVIRLDAYGATADSFALDRRLTLGAYDVQVDARLDERWQSAGSGAFRLAEYRAPEFETSLTMDTTSARYLGDTIRAVATGRYYFGSPLARAVVHWRAYTFDDGGQYTVPGLPAGFEIGESYSIGPQRAGRGDLQQGVDTLDATGRLTLRIPTTPGNTTARGRVDLSVAIDDVNRQSVSSNESMVLDASNLYMAARDSSAAGWYWRPNERRRFQLLAVRPDGTHVPGTSIDVLVIRSRYALVSQADGPAVTPKWLTDTVQRSSVRTTDVPVAFEFTPTTPGYYGVVFSAHDERGRPATTSLGGYVFGGGWTPWGDNPLHLPIDVDPDSAGVGDTLTVRFISPFARAEAWVTVEREEILTQRRVRVSSGESSVRIPVTERFIPGGQVSVVLVDSGSAWRADSVQRRIRTGYASFSIDREPKRLTVDVRPDQRTYSPGDSVRLFVHVRDRQSRPVQGRVTLWGVDESVVALTGYELSDPVRAFYGAWGTSLAFASTTKSIRSLARLLEPPGWNQMFEALTSVRIAGVSALSVAGNSAIVISLGNLAVRRDFRTTAFYVGSLVTGVDGNAATTIKLPDNLTSYHVYALAVTNGSYGRGESSFVVTKPLFARASLPRFLRTGDVMFAGAAINNTTSGSITARVDASGRGITPAGVMSATRTLGDRGAAEMRFNWRSESAPGDSAVMRFDVAGGPYRDAMETSLPIRPPYSPRYHAVAGVARGAATIRMVLPAGIDPTKSHLTLRVGGSPLPIIRTAYARLSVYPFFCSEQLTSVGQVMLTMLRLQAAGVLDSTATPDAATLRGRLLFVLDELARRQDSSGGIAYWSGRFPWTSVWLSSYAGTLLIDARRAGFDVDSQVIARIARFVALDPDTTSPLHEDTYGTRAQRELAVASRLSERLASAQFLRHAWRPDTALENSLLQASPRMRWEDRVWLAELWALRSDRASARAQLARVWRDVEMAGVRADIPDSLLQTLGFQSHVRPVARLFRATRLQDPDDPRLPALIERIAQQGRAELDWMWNTQDYVELAGVLADVITARASTRSSPTVTIRSENGKRKGRPLMTASAAGSVDSTLSLDGLVQRDGDGLVLPLGIETSGEPVFYVVTVDEVPLERPTTPDAHGIVVERWFERFDDGTPTTEVAEGDLVRGRLRITVPADREFVAVEDLLPAGLEMIDASLRTASAGPFESEGSREAEQSGARANGSGRGMPWLYGRWSNGWWSPWEHEEIRDDRVLYFARVLWKGTYTAAYVARATTAGTFIRPPAHAEEMYNPSLGGRSEGGVFRVVPK